MAQPCSATSVRPRQHRYSVLFSRLEHPPNFPSPSYKTLFSFLLDCFLCHFCFSIHYNLLCFWQVRFVDEYNPVAPPPILFSRSSAWQELDSKGVIRVYRDSCLEIFCHYCICIDKMVMRLESQRAAKSYLPIYSILELRSGTLMPWVYWPPGAALVEVK